ncbi:DUF4173 domain-containing protein [Bradyrhizobium sp. 31Argb]|uniref:DUF4153 domain-containing protein n=1 Tax=unclassified Bradyrhizobium TaxID=2631580 RepID=UPI00102E86F5|nr:DUF4173 domain-containing protein [Bradyrhizobium sp. Leo170]TAI67554.1 DUF4173 domain-containing protein [Bradyrhizobium sp. Leo170]
MTSLASPAADIRPVQSLSLSAKLAIAVALAALADFLFYGERVGISVTVFALALACGSLLANIAKLDKRRAMLGGLLVIAGLVPTVEEVNAASLAIILLALGAGLLLTTNPGLTGFGERAAALCDLFLVSPFRFFVDALGMFNLPALTSGFILWFVPALLGTVFLALFVAANPVLEKWISLINPGSAASHLSVARALFWIVAISLVWPFIHVRWRRKSGSVTAAAESPTPAADTSSDVVDFLGAPTILRSLILFNLLFAVQTILDAVYLWGNAALPAGVTYASYAHRGAYPLIVTALLAAGFVLVAIRPGGPAEGSKVIRPLVYLWVAQNVLLVASAIYRLDLYVQIYLLTYWRVAAFIWMLLVAIGLLLIVARIMLDRSNAWLIAANLVTLTAVLYVCSLVNFAAIIADYNVTHSRDVSGKGLQLDINYLAQLGPQALPAIEKVLQLRTSDPCLVFRRDSLVEQQRQDMASWRSWGFRSWRLQRYLDGEQKNKVTG